MTHATTAPPRDLKHFAALEVGALKASRAKNLDLYTLGKDGQTLHLFRGREYEIAADDFARLEQKGVRRLYVPQEQAEAFHKAARSQLTEILVDDAFAVSERFQSLKCSFAVEINKALQRIDADQAVDVSKELGEHLVTLLQAGDFVPRQLYEVMDHDFDTFAHIVNVSSYAVLLAGKLGIAEQNELKQIATGGLLHDLGKRHISATILKKPGRLTEQEFAVIKEHPALGYSELCERGDITTGQLMMVYQHHEKMDGGGYPVGVTGAEIHPWARLCAVVDVFDAVTGERPYRQAMPLPAAIEHISRIAGSHLDGEMAKCWIKTLAAR